MVEKIGLDIYLLGPSQFWKVQYLQVQKLRPENLCRSLWSAIKLWQTPTATFGSVNSSFWRIRLRNEHNFAFVITNQTSHFPIKCATALWAVELWIRVITACRAYSITGPKSWKNLPTDIKNLKSNTSFRNLLNKHLLAGQFKPVTLSTNTS